MEAKSYSNKKFGCSKKSIERLTFNRIPDNSGGFFGLVHKSLNEHYDMYKPKLRRLSPFFVAETDAATFADIRRKAGYINDDRVKLYQGDIFKGLFSSFPKSAHNHIRDMAVYRCPLFSYGHLDFCCTAKGLTDAGFESNMRKLATWWNIKDHFRMDVTVSKRADKGFSTLMLTRYVPELFIISGWTCRKMEVVNYCDTSAMRRVYYEFERKRPWYRNRFHLIHLNSATGIRTETWFNGKRIADKQ